MYFNDKKIIVFKIVKTKSMDVKIYKANVVVIEDFDEDNSSSFMTHIDEYIDNTNVWYMNRGMINHMTDYLD